MVTLSRCAACGGPIYLDSNRCARCGRRDTVWTAIAAWVRRRFRR